MHIKHDLVNTKQSAALLIIYFEKLRSLKMLKTEFSKHLDFGKIKHTTTHTHISNIKEYYNFKTR